MVWTKKSYNLDSFYAKLRSIWKTWKKFEIQVVRHNLFLISFESEEDLELILEGRPWLFCKQLIIFYRLLQLMDRSKLRVIFSPFWIKVGLCPLECDKNDLMHAIGSTFGGVLTSKIKGDLCRIRIQLNV